MRNLGISGEWEDWCGYPRLCFELDGQRAFVIPPEHDRPDGLRPWAWYHHTFLGPNPARPEMNPGGSSYPSIIHKPLFAHLFAAGFWVAGVEIGESYGNPAGREVQTSFYRFVTARLGLAGKACLIAQSRGGLMHYNWAVEHPAWVQCVLGIYPVTDFRTWPPRPGPLWDVAAHAYGLTVEELAARLVEFNPVERLAPLAAARVPILHVHGDVDTTVPTIPNTVAFAERYRDLGGTMEVVLVPGKRHEEAPEIFQHPRLPEFILGASGLPAR